MENGQRRDGEAYVACRFSLIDSDIYLRSQLALRHSRDFLDLNYGHASEQLFLSFLEP